MVVSRCLLEVATPLSDRYYEGRDNLRERCVGYLGRFRRCSGLVESGATRHLLVKAAIISTPPHLSIHFFPLL
ncbi:hypothetical protein CDL15_Pgr017146 [Punica granatum]|uniref:Uncharacterized protein n=1 Tax=Punica granatum TaxID=22663 RepID=A0A218VZF9_PUNGR|nr:hypothetical protein CDL15_Pgr017146 [Punica granatum]